MQVLPETYHALGQDGLRLNRDLLSPTNNSIPTEILEAMYNFSDHLPVICDFDIKNTTKIDKYASSFYINVENPVKNELFMQIFAENDQVFDFEIFNITGQKIDQFSELIPAGNYSFSRRFEYAPSFYIIKITNAQKETFIKKLIK